MTTDAQLIYLDDYSDEICPCQPTLAGWAEWLSQPDEGWGREEAAKDGERFAAGTLEMETDIIAKRDADTNWYFDREAPAGADFFAIRHGAGAGWDADSICGSLDDIIDPLDEYADSTSAEVHIAVGRYVDGLTVIYHAGEPPRCSLVEPEAVIQQP